MDLRITAALLLCLTTPACGDRVRDAGAARADSSPAVASAAPAPGSRAALSPDAAAALDRANAAFRAGRFDAALAEYRAAAARAPSHAAPHYGIYMVARSTRNAALADSAMAAIRALTPSDGSLGDSALAAVHGGASRASGASGASGARALPPGHPKVAPKPPAPWHSPAPRAAPSRATTRQ